MSVQGRRERGSQVGRGGVVRKLLLRFLRVLNMKQSGVGKDPLIISESKRLKHIFHFFK